MPEQKMGGKPQLTVRISAASDVTDFLFSKDQGGTVLDRGLAEAVREEYDGAFQVLISKDAYSGIDELLEHLPAELVEDDVDILALSLRGAIEGPLPADEFEERFDALIRALKDASEAHIIVFNCSSVDPSDDVHTYYGREDTLSLRVHRFNLVLMKMSVAEGISIIDVERLVAQLGGEEHVAQAFHYSAEAHEVIKQEFLRVLDDIGFFEERPLVAQLGQRGLAAAKS